MSAMGDLRLSLLEHGVSYDEYGDGYIHWTHDSASYTAQQNIVGKLIVCNLTPEQAIEATLGCGECKDIGGDVFECSECGCTLDLEDAASCEPTMWVDGEAACPRFCPNCGLEVKR